MEPWGSARLTAFAAILGVAASGGCRESSAAPTPRPAPIADVDQVRAEGRALFFGRGGCHTCHRIGDEGTQIVCPNLGAGDEESLPVGARTRDHYLQGIEYVVESIVDPDAFIVPGYKRGIMRRFEEPPISLTDDEIVALAAFLAGQGPGAPRIDQAAIARARLRIDVTRRAREERGAPPQPSDPPPKKTTTPPWRASR